MTTPIDNTNSNITLYTYYNTNTFKTQTIKGGFKGDSVITYFYDERDRCIKQIQSDGYNQTYVTEYGYDNVGNKTELKIANGQQTTQYTYDSMNRLDHMTWPDGATEYYTYDNNNNMVSKTDRKGTQITYSYDKNSNITGITFNNGTTSTYTYNRANQAATVSNKKGSSVLSSYTYSYYSDVTKKPKLTTQVI